MRMCLAFACAFATCTACSDPPADAILVVDRDARSDEATAAGSRDASAAPPDYGPRCVGFDPNGVWLMGEAVDRSPVGNSDDFVAILSPSDHDVHCQNFEISSAPQIRPDGRLIYVADWWVSHRFELRLLVPDDIDPETGVRTRHADHVVPTPACDDPESWGVERFVVDPRNGNAYYSCLYYDDEPGEHPLRFYDSGGDVFYEGRLLAVSHRGDLLIGWLGGGDLWLQSRLRSAERIPIEWPEAVAGYDAVAVRSHGIGFWVAMVDDGPDDIEYTRRDAYLVSIEPSGHVEILTHYPQLEGVDEYARLQVAALDAEGDLYEVRPTNRDESTDQVARRRRDGSPSEVIWDETQQPDGGLPLYVGDRSYFATGP
jgi:hypothetical protein